MHQFKKKNLKNFDNVHFPIEFLTKDWCEFGKNRCGFIEKMLC